MKLQDKHGFWGVGGGVLMESKCLHGQKDCEQQKKEKERTHTEKLN